MICRKCGENLPDNARECFTCGAKVRKPQPVAEVVEVAPPEVSVVKPPRPAGEVLKEVFSSSSYLIMCIFLVIHTVFLIGVNVLVFYIPELDFKTMISSVISIVMESILIVPSIAMYVKAKAVKEPTGDDFVKLLKILHVYMIVNLVASIIGSVSSFISMGIMSLFSFGGVVVEIVSLVLSILPIYSAYQLTGSLIKSCEKGRMMLEGVGVLRVYVILYEVLMIILTVLMALLAIIEEPIIFLVALFTLCYAIFMLRIHNFLYLLQDKSKY